MNPSEASYNQPEKEEVRQRVIAGAVRNLTADRHTSPVVTAEEFDRTMDYVLRFLEKNCDLRLWDAVKSVAEEWHALHRSRVGAKHPEDLTVLFLAGPNPKADIMAFKNAGVPYTNIWAVEGDNETFAKAIGLLGTEGLSIKIHNGTLQTFFSIHPQQFDIVYFDTCNQFFGRKPSTAAVIRELFLNQRLAPLSVLITNFCEPYPNLDPDLPTKALLRNRLRKSPAALAKLVGAPENTDLGIVEGKITDPTQEERELLKWGRLIGIWSYVNAPSDDPITDEFEDFVETEITFDLLAHYSRFTTEFIIQFAGQLLPWWRTVALPGSNKEYFSNKEQLAKAVEDAEGVPGLLGNVMYTTLRHVVAVEEYLDKTSPLHEFYFKDAFHQTKLGDAVKAASLIRTFLETQGGNPFPTEHILQACSPALNGVLRIFRWFDNDSGAFCYELLPHLLTDLLLGLYGHPYHANTRKLDRIAYKAEKTVMFTDVFVLDQARYLYEQLPTLPLFDKNLPVPQQLVLRVCMDAIRRHAYYGCPDLFYMSDLAASGDNGFTYWQAPRRESVGCPDIEAADPPAATDDCPF